MEREKQRRWTEDENDVLLRYVKAYPHNLTKAFLLVSEHLTESGTPRTPSGVSGHWYTVLSKRKDVLVYFTASQKYVSKNRKNGVGVETSPSIWRRFLNIIRSI